MAQPTNVKPGNSERGWNDPPVLLHSVDTIPSAPPQKRNLLSRRVFHSSDANAASQPSAANKDKPPPVSNDLLPGTSPMDIPPQNVVLLPPATTTALSSFPAPILIPNMSPSSPSPFSLMGSPPHSPQHELTQPFNPTDEVEIPHFTDDKQLFHYTASRLKKILHRSKESMGPRASEDVSKKLAVFESMWEEGKISYPVKAAMAKLSIALHEGKYDLANHIHLSLMMDYVSEVGQWMVAVKRLIQEAINLGPLSPLATSPPDDSTAAPLPAAEKRPSKSELNTPSPDDVPESDSSSATPGVSCQHDANTSEQSDQSGAASSS